MSECDTCRTLLSQGLDLCVRAGKLEEMDRRSAFLSVSSRPKEWQESEMFDVFVCRFNAVPDNDYKQIGTNGRTVPLWLNDQYQRDLFEWEGKARSHLMRCADE